MSERDFSVGGTDFKLGKIDAFKQFHIVRRLGPVLGDIFPVIMKMKGKMKPKSGKDAKPSEEDTLKAMADLAGPFMNGMAKLSDEDADKVLLGLLSSVEIRQGQIWSRLANDAGLMFDTMDFSTLMQVAGKAFAYNLAGFFAVAPQVSHGQNSILSEK